MDDAAVLALLSWINYQFNFLIDQGLCLFTANKVLLNDPVQLCGNTGKTTIQIQCPDADLVTAHMVYMIRLHLCIRLCIQQHACHVMRSISIF